VESAARVQIDQADQRQILPEERFRAAKSYISLFLVGTWHLLRGSSKQVSGRLLDGTWFGYISSGPGFRDEAFELVPGQKLVAPQNKFSMRPGLGIYLQDLDLGTKPPLNKSF